MASDILKNNRFGGPTYFDRRWPACLGNRQEGRTGLAKQQGKGWPAICKSGPPLCKIKWMLLFLHVCATHKTSIKLVLSWMDLFLVFWTQVCREFLYQRDAQQRVKLHNSRWPLGLLVVSGKPSIAYTVFQKCTKKDPLLLLLKHKSQRAFMTSKMLLVEISFERKNEVFTCQLQFIHYTANECN